MADSHADIASYGGTMIEGFQRVSRRKVEATINPNLKEAEYRQDWPTIPDGENDKLILDPNDLWGTSIIGRLGAFGVTPQTLRDRYGVGDLNTLTIGKTIEVVRDGMKENKVAAMFASVFFRNHADTGEMLSRYRRQIDTYKKRLGLHLIGSHQGVSLTKPNALLVLENINGVINSVDQLRQVVQRDGMKGISPMYNKPHIDEDTLLLICKKALLMGVTLDLAHCQKEFRTKLFALAKDLGLTQLLAYTHGGISETAMKYGVGEKRANNRGITQQELIELLKGGGYFGTTFIPDMWGTHEHKDGMVNIALQDVYEVMNKSGLDPTKTLIGIGTDLPGYEPSNVPAIVQSYEKLLGLEDRLINEWGFTSEQARRFMLESVLEYAATRHAKMSDISNRGMFHK